MDGYEIFISILSFSVFDHPLSTQVHTLMSSDSSFTKMNKPFGVFFSQGTDRWLTVCIYSLVYACPIGNRMRLERWRGRGP